MSKHKSEDYKLLAVQHYLDNKDQYIWHRDCNQPPM